MELRPRAKHPRRHRGVRELYDRQDFNFAGPWGDNGFIEDYNAEVRSRPLGAVHLVTFNADGQAQHIAANLPAAELGDVLLPPAA